MSSQPREQWSSRLAFLLSTIGSAVGLANIWRFPYTVGTGGGAVFLLTFLLSVAALALPLLIAELMVGRRYRVSPPNAIRAAAVEAGASPRWRFLGLAGVAAAILVLSFYSVVGGWVMAYILDPAADSAGIAQARFDGLVGDPVRLFGWSSLFLWATVAISARGITGGVELANKVMTPILFLLLLAMAGYAMLVGDVAAAARFLFTPDFSKVTPDVLLDAFGQAFFALGVGATNLMAYGSYMDRGEKVIRSSVIIVGSAVFVSLLSGFAVFPVLFAMGLDPAGGPALTFVTLPYMFAHMPGGVVVGVAFFVLLFAAAITSAISMMEAPVSFLTERLGWKRAHAALLSGGLSWGLCILSVLSFNIWSDVKPLAWAGLLTDKTFFGLFDYLTSNVVLPGGGCLIAVLVGWKISRAVQAGELGEGLAFRAWRFCIRWLAPLALAVIFAAKVVE